ncbi:MAG: GlcG/HbpS family heme-binding protein [Chloroflexota bacterium]
MKELTAEMAMTVLAASERWSRDIAGLPSSIAVVDKSGTVIAAHRMDGAGPLTIDIAIEKAWSVIAFRQPTLMLSRFLDPRNVGSALGDHGMGLVTKGKGRLTLIAGSVPITDDEGEIIGAIGSSGIPSGVGDISDTSVCQAGWAALYD